MNVFFSPEYSGFCFTGLKQRTGQVAFDMEVDGLPGLLGLLELHAGYHWSQQDNSTRIIEYYRAMMEYMTHHHDDILKSSFDIDGLSTAAKCLIWRDRLVMAGWSASSKSAEGRIKTLQGIEEYFDSPGEGERIEQMTTAIKDGCVLPKDLSIIIPCSIDMLHPDIQNLLKALEGRSVEISSLQADCQEDDTDLGKVRRLLTEGNVTDKELKGDGSFRIFSFPTVQEALQRMSLRDMDKFDVWINPSNKPMDNMLYMQGQPVAGSSTLGGFPVLSQTFIVGLGQFQKPMNLSTMLTWLQLPMSPIPWSARNKFVDAIVRSGGYYNDKCRNLKTELTESDNKLADVLDTFMPSMETPKDVLSEKNVVDIDWLRAFTKAMATWLSQQVAVLQNKGQETEAEQLAIAFKQADSMELLLQDSHIGGEIPFNRLQGWIGSLYEPASFVQYEAQAGCRNVIDSPGKMIAACNSTVWYGFNGGEPISPMYSFLSPREKEEMPDLLIWNEDKERRYRQAMKLMPFMTTEKELVLVTCKDDVGKPLPKEPILIQLESTFKNLDKEPITTTPGIPDSLKEIIPKVNNHLDDLVGFNIDNGDKLKWPEQESATSLDTLIQNPMDYVINNLLHIDGTGVADMQAVYRTEGNVAHAVIAELFDKKEDVEGSGTYNYIKENVAKNFDGTFNRIILSEGALLLQSENRVDAKILKDQLRRCIGNLLEIIHDNGLHVEACEKNIKCDDMGFKPNITITGYLDMRLADDNGGQYVFDFKWTTSSRYEYALEENRSLQLALYAELIRRQMKKDVVAEAYFLMPRGKLYSTYPFAAGDNFEQLELAEDAPKDNTIDMVRHSYTYRRSQITEGEIEMGEGQALELLPYGEDMEECHLLPLACDSGKNKRPNYYSNNAFLKQ